MAVHGLVIAGLVGALRLPVVASPPVRQPPRPFGPAVNEDERGITPAGETSITIDRPGRDWRVIIEQGNGDVIKMFDLTEMERMQLAAMLGTEPLVQPSLNHVSFVDFTRDPS